MYCLLSLCSNYRVFDPNNYSSLYSVGDKDTKKGRLTLIVDTSHAI